MNWVEQTPEVHCLSIESFHRRLSALEYMRLMLASSPSVYVIFPEQVRNSVLQHLKQAPVELGGLLIGSVYRQTESAESTPLIIDIQRAVPCTEAESTGVSLRMETSVWKEAGQYIGGTSMIVGWYHSHPNLGVFFSGTDRTTQRNFFKSDFSLGLVVDHIRKEEAWFIGAESHELSKVLIRDRL